VNLDVFFSEGNQPYPPALSREKQTWSRGKSDLTYCLTNNNIDHLTKLFIISYLQGELQRVRRIDVVWDCYYEDSLTNACRKKLGIPEASFKVTGQTKLPKNWQGFLKDARNKEERFLAHMMLKSSIWEIFLTNQEGRRNSSKILFVYFVRVNCSGENESI